MLKERKYLQELTQKKNFELIEKKFLRYKDKFQEEQHDCMEAIHKHLNEINGKEKRE